MIHMKRRSVVKYDNPLLTTDGTFGQQTLCSACRELRNCVKVEVAVLGFPSPTNLRMVFVERG